MRYRDRRRRKMYQRIRRDVFMMVDLFMQVHHKDDARHIATARATLKFLLKRFLRAMNIPNPGGAAKVAAQSPERKAFADDCARSAMQFIERMVILPPELAQPE